jgi:hypothetical protein
MNQYKRMLLVDLDGVGQVSEILYEILVFFLDDGQSDVGINTSWVQFQYSAETSFGHLIFFEVKETVCHADSGLDGESLECGEDLFVVFEGFGVVSFKEVNLSETQHCDEFSLIASARLMRFNDSIEHIGGFIEFTIKIL